MLAKKLPMVLLYVFGMSIEARYDTVGITAEDFAKVDEKE
jgi:hypothetical protein